MRTTIGLCSHRCVFRIFVLALWLSAMAGICPCAGPVWAADLYSPDSNALFRDDGTSPGYAPRADNRIMIRGDDLEPGNEQYAPNSYMDRGLLQELEQGLEMPNALKPAKDRESDDVQIGTLYNLNEEGTYLPAFSLGGSLEFPTGEDSRGIDTELKLMASKRLGTSPTLQRLHLNLSWNYNDDAAEDERANYYIAVVGYDRRIGSDTLLIVDFMREQEKEEDKESHSAELGIQHHLTPLTVLSIGAGSDIGEESPELKTTIKFQHSF